MNITELSSNGGPSGSSSLRARIVGDDADTLRELITLHIGQGNAYAGDSTIFVGQLPASGLGANLPLPEEATLVGSIARGRDSLEILLTSAADPEAFVADYKAVLLTKGWGEAAKMHWGQTFIDRKQFTERLCQVAENVVLAMSGSADTDGGCIVRVNLNRQLRPCESPHAGIDDIYRLLPTLQSPAVSRIIAGNQGAGSGHQLGTNHLSSTAHLLSEQPLATVAEAYQTQLAALANWTLHSAHTTAQTHISLWLIADEEATWSATFTLAANPQADNAYLLMLYLADYTGEV